MSAQQASLAALKVGNGFDVAGRWCWPSFAVTACLVLLFLSLRQTITPMVHTWISSRTYSHCFLVPPMFGYLVWVRRKRIFAVQPCPNYWGFLCLAILAVVWLLGSLGEARVVEEFALLAMIGALIWALLGTQVLHILRFPLAFLFFAVPFGVALVPPLQDSTAWFVIHALTLSNVPAVLDNRTISLPNSVWTIAETCSGIRYMFASIVLGLFYSSLVYRLRKRQLLFLGASIALPVAANALRAYGIVLVGYLSNNKLAVGVDHIIYGGVFFVAIEIALLAAGVRWRESPELAAEEPRESITGVPFPRKLVIAAPAAAGVLLLTPLLSEYLWNKSAADPAPAELAVLVDPSWREAATYDYGWNPGLHRPDRELGQEYESGEHRVHLYCALYSGQRGTELAGSSVGYGNPGLWSVASEKVGHEFLHGRSVTVNKSLLQSGLNMRSVWTMYWVGGEYTASPARAKLLQAKARLLGNAASAVVIVLGSEDLSNRPDTAERTLQDFLAHASFPMSSQL